MRLIIIMKRLFFINEKSRPITLLNDRALSHKGDSPAEEYIAAISGSAELLKYCKYLMEFNTYYIPSFEH